MEYHPGNIPSPKIKLESNNASISDNKFTGKAEDKITCSTTNKDAISKVQVTKKFTGESTCFLQQNTF